MHPIPELTSLLKQLRLSGILDSLEARNREAIDRKLAFTDFLSLLIHDEVARRDQKTLDGFDFNRLPGLMRIPRKLNTCSAANWTVIPAQTGQRFYAKLDT